ncbi:MAG: tyrosine-type recombinase/integrase [Nanoarchaeota archaeon]
MDISESIKKEALRRGYSLKTIKTYQKCVEKFLNDRKKGLSKISKADVKEFLDKLIEKGRAGNTINVYLNSLKFLLEEILNKKMKLNIKYSKKPVKLPIVLTREELIRLFNVIKNEKHKLMIELIYSAGLRVSELLNLKVKDLELEKNYSFVRQGKGNKDRIFIIAEKLKQRIKDLIKKENLGFEDNVFLSNRKYKYNARSIQEIVKKAAKRAKINKKISPHTLRHSFATHLIENGYSISEVQALLGHKSPETTFIYVHTASPNMIKVKSPLDDLI